MMVGRTKIIRNEEQHYQTLFNQRNGFFARIEDFGYPEPMWSNIGPELLDISITNYCDRDCKFCYRNSHVDGKHMDLKDLEMILEQCREISVLQIALGGGNPNQHPHFNSFLKLIREADIIPTYTSNGNGLTHDILVSTSDYCGAIGISAYPPYDLLGKRVREISKYGIKVNLHVILSVDTIDRIIEWLRETPEWFECLNAIIFLNYKPINNLQDYERIDDRKLEMFFALVHQSSVKVGFDSCSISGVLKCLDTPRYLIEPCEAARFSAFISEECKMYPCSFMVNDNKYGDLKLNSIQEIWRNNEHFNNMRMKCTDSCSSCKLWNDCKGGCSFIPEINFCKDIPIL